MLKQEIKLLDLSVARNSRAIYLDLSRKKLKRLPIPLFSLQHLCMLSLEGNLLDSLPGELFTHLPHLMWLDVRNNQIKIISSKIVHCSELAVLNLQNNCLQQLPMKLGLLTKMKILELSGNPIIYPSPDILRQGAKKILQYLKADYYHLTEHFRRIPIDKEDKEDCVVKKTTKTKAKVMQISKKNNRKLNN